MSATLSLILLATLPFQFALPIGNGWDMPLARALALGVIVTFICEQLIQRKLTLNMPQSAILISFLAWVVVSLLWVSRLDIALPKVAFLFNILPLFFVWQEQLSQPEQRDRLIQAFLVGAGLAAVSSLTIFLAQFVFGVSETFHFLLERILPLFLGQELAQMVAQYPSLLVNIGGDTWLRATAFFPDPHVAAFFFGLSGFLALGFSKQTSDYRYVIIAGLLFLADILSFSRGGYIGLLAGAVSYSILNRNMLWPNMGQHVPRALFSLVVVIFTFGPAVLSRFVTSINLAEDSSLERLTLWSAAMGAIQEHPLLGTGIGNYLSLVHPLAQATVPFYAHNLFFDVTLEIGLIGALMFFALFGTVLYDLWRQRQFSPLVPGVGGAIGLYLVHSLFETALFSVHVSIVLMFLLALATSLRPSDLIQSDHDTSR